MEDPAAFVKAKKLFVLACVGIALGLAVSGSFDSKAGGVIVVSAWLVSIVALHRLGRSGSDRSRPAD